MTREQEQQQQLERVESMCRRFLDALVIDQEIVEWCWGRHNEPRELCMDCRARMKELGWGSEHISPDELAEAITEELRDEPLEITSCLETGDRLDPGTFELLLCTGGPAMRVVGRVNRYGEGCDAVVQWQDWFKPWTSFQATSGAQREALEWFCNLFCFEC